MYVKEVEDRRLALQIIRKKIWDMLLQMKWQVMIMFIGNARLHMHEMCVKDTAKISLITAYCSPL